MAITESDMNALREMLREIVADECGKAAKGTEDRLGARFVALEQSVNGRVEDLSLKVDGLDTKLDAIAADVNTIVARLDVSEEDVRSARVKLALLARAKS